MPCNLWLLRIDIERLAQHFFGFRRPSRCLQNATYLVQRHRLVVNGVSGNRGELRNKRHPLSDCLI